VEELGDWKLLEARDINDDGGIVGNGLRNGKKRGFVLVPIDAGELSIHPSLCSARKHQRGIGVLRLASPAPRDRWLPSTHDRTSAGPCASGPRRQVKRHRMNVSLAIALILVVLAGPFIVFLLKWLDWPRP